MSPIRTPAVHDGLALAGRDRLRVGHLGLHRVERLLHEREAQALVGEDVRADREAEHDHADDREEVGEVLLDRGGHPPLAFRSLSSRRWYAAFSLATSGRTLSTKSCAPLIMSRRVRDRRRRLHDLTRSRVEDREGRDRAAGRVQVRQLLRLAGDVGPVRASACCRRRAAGRAGRGCRAGSRRRGSTGCCRRKAALAREARHAALELRADRLVGVLAPRCPSRGSGSSGP